MSEISLRSPSGTKNSLDHPYFHWASAVPGQIPIAIASVRAAADRFTVVVNMEVSGVVTVYHRLETRS